MNIIPSIDIAASSRDPGITYQVNDPQFSPLRVEPLIDQSIDILERALRLRAEYDALAAKLFDAQYEVDNLEREIAVQKDEDSSGYNLLPFQQSSADLSAMDQYIDQTVAHINEFKKDLSDYIRDSTDHISYAAACEAGAMKIPFRKEEYDDGKEEVTLTFWPNGPNVKNDPTPISLIAELAAGDQQRYEMTLELAKARADFSSDQIAVQRAMAQEGTPIDTNHPAPSGMYAKQLMDQKSAAYKAQRRVNLDNQRVSKSDAITADNGALHFQGAMDRLIDRYSRDFGDAVARITQAALGLQQLYGYVDPVPRVDNGKVPIEIARGDQPGARFDDWIIWLRNAASWLIKFSQTDQPIAVPVSVKSLANDWKAFTSGNESTLLLDPLPSVPASLKLRNVRLRGISVFASFASDKDFPGSLQILITPPSKNIPYQDQIRPCYAGRVLPRSIPQRPDVLGADELYNASPFGEWKVQMLSRKDAVDGLQDIEIDLLLVVQILNEKR